MDRFHSFLYVWYKLKVHEYATFCATVKFAHVPNSCHGCIIIFHTLNVMQMLFDNTNFLDVLCTARSLDY